MKKCLVTFALSLIPLAVFLIIGEISLRALELEPYVRTFPGQYQNHPEGGVWAQSDPALGWTSNKMDPEMNPQGFRDPKDFSAINLASPKKRVMVLGDSFIWGAGVGRVENIPSLLQARLQDNYEVFNLGVPGWGIDQMYLAYQQYRNVIQPDVVILAFSEDNVKRVLEAYHPWERLNKPTFTVKNNQLVLRTSTPKSQAFLQPALARSVFLSRVLQEIYLTTDARPIVEKIFTGLAEDTQRRKEELVIIRIPTRDHFKIPARINRNLYDFKAILQDTGALYLDSSKEMTLVPGWSQEFYLDNGQLSVAGNHYVASYVFRHVFEPSDQVATLPDQPGAQRVQALKAEVPASKSQ